MTAKLLKDEALRLSSRERAELAAALLDSLEKDTEDLWVEEAERRYEAYKQGRLSGRDAGTAVAELRQRIR